MATTTIDLGGVADTSKWQANSCASVAAPTVTLINNTTSDDASLISSSTLGVAGSTRLSFSLELYGSADHIHVGFLDASKGQTREDRNGICDYSDFYGILLNIYSGSTKGISPVIAGVIGSRFAYDPPMSMPSFVTWDVEFVVASLGGLMTINVYRNGTLVTSFTGTAPSYPTAVVGIGAFTGGLAAVLAATGNPTASVADATGAVVSNLTADPYNGMAVLRWTDTFGSHDYRVDGGNPVSAGSYPLVVTGLSNDVAHTIDVRPTSGATVGNWTSVTVTPTNNGSVYDDFNRANVAPGANVLGSAESGQAWTQPSGNLGISGNAAYASASGENLGIIAGVGYNVDVSIVIGATVAHDQGIIFRYRDVNNYWLLNCGSDSKHYLQRKLNGSFYNIANDNTKPVLGETIRVEAINNVIRVWVSGSIAFSSDDIYSQVTDTGAGLRINAASAGVDSFSARVPATSEIPNLNGTLADPYADGAKSVLQNTEPAWVYKGWDSKDLDIVGAV